MEKLTIKNGWFYSAGLMYGWKKDGFDVCGVGIEKKYFAQPELELDVLGVSYTLDTVKGREFINKYKSHKKMRGVHIGVVSKSLLIPKTKSLFEEDIEWFDSLQ